MRRADLLHIRAVQPRIVPRNRFPEPCQWGRLAVRLRERAPIPGEGVVSHTFVNQTTGGLVALWLALTPGLTGAQDQPATPADDPVMAAAMFRGNAARTGEQPGPGLSGEPVLRWQFETDGRVDSTPVVVDGIVYFGSDDGNVYAVAADTAEERWRFAAAGAVDSSPAVANGLVYVGSADGSFYALDASSGEVRWQVETPGAITSSPVVVGELVYFS